MIEKEDFTTDRAKRQPKSGRGSRILGGHSGPDDEEAGGEEFPGGVFLVFEEAAAAAGHRACAA